MTTLQLIFGILTVICGLLSIAIILNNASKHGRNVGLWAILIILFLPLTVLIYYVNYLSAMPKATFKKLNVSLLGVLLFVVLFNVVETDSLNTPTANVAKAKQTSEKPKAKQTIEKPKASASTTASREKLLNTKWQQLLNDRDLQAMINFPRSYPDYRQYPFATFVINDIVSRLTVLKGPDFMRFYVSARTTLAETFHSDKLDSRFHNELKQDNNLVTTVKNMFDNSDIETRDFLANTLYDVILATGNEPAAEVIVQTWPTFPLSEGIKIWLTRQQQDRQAHQREAECEEMEASLEARKSHLYSIKNQLSSSKELLEMERSAVIVNDEGSVRAFDYLVDEFNRDKRKYDNKVEIWEEDWDTYIDLCDELDGWD